jgi:hypothetical protein
MGSLCPHFTILRTGFGPLPISWPCAVQLQQIFASPRAVGFQEQMIKAYIYANDNNFKTDFLHF